MTVEKESHPFGLDYFNQFVNGYMKTALWSSTDDEGDPLDDRFSANDLSAESRMIMTRDSKKFIEENTELLSEYNAIYEDDAPSLAGHNFWLTRNGHGAGFWSDGLGELGDKLSEACKEFGEQYVYVGDDGKLYIS